MSYTIGVRAHPSALKHGVAEADIIQAASVNLDRLILGDDPQRAMRFGFDTHGRVLEVVVLTDDFGQEHAIHAMKIRKQYQQLLQERGW